jgi:predicted patatin/cPLA2 family phospholipase
MSVAKRIKICTQLQNDKSHFKEHFICFIKPARSEKKYENPQAGKSKKLWTLKNKCTNITHHKQQNYTPVENFLKTPQKKERNTTAMLPSFHT